MKDWMCWLQHIRRSKLRLLIIAEPFSTNCTFEWIINLARFSECRHRHTEIAYNYLRNFFLFNQEEVFLPSLIILSTTRSYHKHIFSSHPPNRNSLRTASSFQSLHHKDTYSVPHPSMA